MNPLILLTGATGFVGRHVHQALVTRGCRVRLVVREGSSSPAGGEEAAGSVITTPDLFAESASWWARACEGVGTVVHLAWYSEPGRYLGSSRNLACLAGTMQLALGASTAGVARIVGVGTCAEYQTSTEALTTDAPLVPLSVYAAAKMAAYVTLSQWLPSRNIEFAWCRLFYLYGEGEDSRRLVPYLRQRLEAGLPADLSSGEQVRDFMDVRDAANRIAEVALGREQGAVNVCTGVGTTVRQLAERIADEYGRRDLLRFGTRPDNPFDPPSVVGVPSRP